MAQSNITAPRRETYQEDLTKTKFLVLVSLNGHWHREWNYVLSEITKFNFVKTIMFWAKTMSAKEG